MSTSAAAREGRLSLEELCIRTAIDNVDLLGDVGQTDVKFLRRVLPHCNVDQLMKIETCTRDRDLSQITNILWLNFYKKKFGEENVNIVIKRMKETKRSFRWKDLYQAKLREQDEVQNKGVDRLRELYKEAGQKKASRQLQQVDIVPMSNKKRQQGSSGSRSGPGGKKPATEGRGRLMMKARKEYTASLDARSTVVRKK